MTYFQGNKAEYTGEYTTNLYGETCYELKILEGHRKGINVWTYRSPKEQESENAEKLAVQQRST